MDDRQVLDALRATRPFRRVRVKDAEGLDGMVTWRSFAAGDLVARKGSRAGSMFIVVDGRVRVGTKQDPSSIQLTAGDTAGEASALERSARPSSIRAEERTTLLELSSEGLDHLVSADQRIADALGSLPAGSFRDTAGSTEDPPNRVPAPTPATHTKTAGPEPTVDDDQPSGLQLRAAALLAWNSLTHRRSRVLTTLASVAMIFTMVLLISGMAEQFHQEPRTAIESLGAENWIVGPDATGVFTSAATLPTGVVDEVLATPSAGTLTPIVAARSSFADEAGIHDIIVIGHLPTGPGAPVVREGATAGDGEVVVSAASPARIGDVIRLGSSQLRVVGRADEITLFAGLPLAWMPLEQAQQLVYGGQSTLNAILADGPAPTSEDWSVLTNEEVIEDAMRPLERAFSSVVVMSVLLWIVAGLVLGAVAYVTALERTRDFAVIKAIGGSDSTLLASLTLQSLFTAVAAAVLAGVLQGFVSPVFPLAISVPTSALWQLPILAVAVAILASVAGMRRIRRIDPAAAFGAAT